MSTETRRPGNSPRSLSDRVDEALERFAKGYGRTTETVVDMLFTVAAVTVPGTWLILSIGLDITLLQAVAAPSSVTLSQAAVDKWLSLMNYLLGAVCVAMMLYILRMYVRELNERYLDPAFSGLEHSTEFLKIDGAYYRKVRSELSDEVYLLAVDAEEIPSDATVSEVPYHRGDDR